MEFTGRFVNDSIVDKREYNDNSTLVHSYFQWKLSGFTKKAFFPDLAEKGIDQSSETKTIRGFHESGHLF